MILGNKAIVMTTPLPSWIAPRPRPEARTSPLAAVPRVAAASPVSPASGGASPNARSLRPPSPDVAQLASEPANDPLSEAPPPSVAGPVEAALENALRGPRFVPGAVDSLARELGMQAEIAGLQSALAAAVAETARVRREVLEASLPSLVELAVAIAQQVIGQKVAEDPAIVARLAREGVDALLDQEDLVVAVSPDLAAKVPAEVWASALEGHASVVTDPSLEPMRCEVRGKKARVGVDPEARLRAVVLALDDDEVAPSSAQVPR